MSLYRRPNSSNYWCRFTIRGREVRQSTGTADRAQAEEYEAHLRSRYWREIKLGDSFHTFGQAGERWLRDTEKLTKAKDAAIIDWFNYQRDEDGKIVAKLWIDLPLREITRDVIDTAREKLAEGNLSKTTINHYMGTLRAILRKSHFEWHWIEVLPKVPMYKRVLPDPVWTDRAGFRRLARELPEHSADMARFAVAAGPRAGNVSGLTWDRVDLRRRTAYVPSSQAKAKRGIPIPLNADAIAILKRWKGKHPTHVFSYQGKPIRYITTKAWHAAVKRAGIDPRFTFHSCRHTWASWQIQAGTPISIVKEMGGWADYQMVMRYAHLNPGHLAAYSDRTLLGTPRRRRAAKRA